MINIGYLASMPEDAINPYADEPLYVQLAGIVRRMIQTGKLQHLDPVPSESSLVQAYGVSRTPSAAPSHCCETRASCSPSPTAAPTSARDRSSGAAPEMRPSPEVTGPRVYASSLVSAGRRLRRALATGMPG